MFHHYLMNPMNPTVLMKIYFIKECFFEDLLGVTYIVRTYSNDIGNIFLKYVKMCLFPPDSPTDIYNITTVLKINIYNTVRIYMTPSYLYPNSFKITQTMLILNKSIPGSQRQALVLFFVVMCSLNGEFVWVD